MTNPEQKEGEVLYATKRLLDSVWTLAYQLTGKNEIKVLTYDRENPIGYEREKELPRVRMEEETGRILTAVYFRPYIQFEDGPVKEGPQHRVINPKNVFDYR
jgi:hypothetical protein